MVVTEFIAERPDVADEEIMHNSNRVVSMLHESAEEPASSTRGDRLATRPKS